MQEKSVRELSARLSCALDWPREFVGIRFLFTEEAYQRTRAQELRRPIHYCQMVKAATCGHAIKASASTHGCPAAARALGIVEVGEMHRSGRTAFSNCLYHDFGTAKNARDRQTICDHVAFGVLVKPLPKYRDDEMPPHVIQVITNPYNAMRLIQGYSYYYSVRTAFKFSGLQALCAESTAYPYMANDINLSLLCGGTRKFCQWHDDELAVSIPFSKFAQTVEGTLRTMNLEDPDEKKAIARERLRQNGMEAEFPLQDGFHYCTMERSKTPL